LTETLGSEHLLSLIISEEKKNTSFVPLNASLTYPNIHFAFKKKKTTEIMQKLCLIY